MEQDIPSYLSTPPTSDVSLPVRTKAQELPFGELRWEDFERLCLRLVRQEAEVEHCQLYGKPGQAQGGIDIIARKEGGQKYSVFQCKRESNYGPAKIKAAVTEFANGEWVDRADTFVLCTKESLRGAQRAEEFERQAELLRDREVRLLPWDSEVLSPKLKLLPEVVDDFFGRAWVGAFCGEEAATSLGDRLDASEVATLRRELGTFYRRVFLQHDPGLPAPAVDAIRPLAIEDRYVLPDIEDQLVPSAAPEAKEAQSVTEGMATTIDSSSSAGGYDNNFQRGHASSGGVRLTYERRLPAENWLAQNTRSIVLGDPGVGKSSLLRFLAIDLLSESPRCAGLAERWGNLLPVWVPFALWTRLVSRSAAGTCALSEAVHEWLRSWDEERLWPVVEKAIRDQRLLLLVDGLDEWTDESAGGVVLDRLFVFVARRDLPAVVTSRPLGFKKLGRDEPEWQKGRLCGLSKDQQENLCERWFTLRASHVLGKHPADDDVGRVAAGETQAFLSELNQSPDLAELSRNPLLLGLLIYLNFRNVHLPHSRFQAYDDLIGHLISVHPARRRQAAGIPDSPDLGILPDEIRHALACFAFDLQEKHPEGAAEDTDAKAVVKAFLEQALGLDSRQAAVTSNRLLGVAEGEVGILVKKAPHETGFLHRVFQEYLAADHLSRLPLSQQLGLVTERCCDPQWHEIILGLFSLTSRPDDTTQLVEAIQNGRPTAAERYLIQQLLSQVAFGNFNLDVQVVRQLAAEAFREIEVGSWRPQRKTLLSSALDGLRSTRAREIVKRRLATWFPCRSRWRGALYDAMAEWPMCPELMECLWRGMHDEEAGNQRAAARAVAKLTAGDSEVRDRLTRLVRSAMDAKIVAAALSALVEGWEVDAELAGLLGAARSSASPELRLVGIDAKIRRGEQEDEDREDLFRLSSRDEQVDYTWREDVAPLLTKGWPGSLELKETCLRAAQGSACREEAIGRRTALWVLLTGYPQDNEVAELCANEIRNQRFPFVGMGSLGGGTWKSLAENFRDNRLLAEAIDEWLAKQEVIGPEEAAAAQLGRTPMAKQKLLELADQGFIFWPISALLDGWGMADPDVAERLEAIAWDDAGMASEIGHWLPRIIRDQTRCRQRLLDLIRGPDCRRPDFVVRGLREVGVPGDQEDLVVDAVMRALPDPSNISYTTAAENLILLLPHHARVRDFAVKEAGRLHAPLGAIAEAYPDDDHMKQRIMTVANPLPTDLRLQVAVHLGEKCQDRQIALSYLGQYDEEEDESVKVQASVGYYSHLRETDQDTDNAADVLSKDIVCYGPDYEERRRAAFAGLVILDRLDIMKAARETIGDEPRCGIDLGWPHRPNVPLCRLICENWDKLKSDFGDELALRLGRRRRPNEVGLWRILACVADEYPSARNDALSVLESAVQAPWASHELDTTILRFLSRATPRSRLLLDYCLKGLFEDRDGTLGALERQVVAAEILGSHFGGREDVLARIVPQKESDRLDDSVILPLCEGWPESSQLDGIFRLVFQKRPPVSCASHVWLRSLKARPKVLLEFVCQMLSDYRRFFNLESVGTSRPVIRRLASDDAFFALTLEKLKKTRAPAERVTFARLLGAAATGNQEFRKWCVDELHAALTAKEIAEVGFDLTLGELTPLPHVLLDILHGVGGSR